MKATDLPALEKMMSGWIVALVRTLMCLACSVVEAASCWAAPLSGRTIQTPFEAE